MLASWLSIQNDRNLCRENDLNSYRKKKFEITIKKGSQSVYIPFLYIYTPKSLSVHPHLSTGTPSWIDLAIARIDLVSIYINPVREKADYCLPLKRDLKIQCFFIYKIDFFSRWSFKKKTRRRRENTAPFYLQN